MKIRNNLMILAMVLFAFTACKNNEKNANDAEGTFNEDMEMSDPQEQVETPVEKEVTTTVVDVVKGSEKHSTLLAAMEDAGIIVKLEGANPYTIFAPTNAAFEDLPKGTIDDWMKPENSEELEGVLSYHLIPGKVDSAKLKDLIGNGENGEYVLVTANDGKLTATINDAGNIILTDASGGKATIMVADMNASNGVVHSIDSVLMRK